MSRNLPRPRPIKPIRPIKKIRPLKPIKPIKPLPDMTVSDHGSIVLLTPETDRGREWCDENLGGEQIKFGPAIACEPRYAPAIIEGAQADGLELVLS